jgi:hypothetical protein
MYRILTENKNVDEVWKALRVLGLDYTLYFGRGSWQGKREKSLMIELDDVSRCRAVKAAKVIKELNGQDAILLQHIRTNSDLL